MTEGCLSHAILTEAHVGGFKCQEWWGNVSCTHGADTPQAAAASQTWPLVLSRCLSACRAPGECSKEHVNGGHFMGTCEKF